MRFSELLPRSDTQSYMLLELTAICGEFPADLLSRLPGSDSYKMTIIWALKRDKLLKTYYKDRLRGLKSEFSRRLRLHRLAEIYLLMQKSGIAIFRDEKPQIFSPEGSAVETIAFPAFYSSREIKELKIPFGDSSMPAAPFPSVRLSLRQRTFGRSWNGTCFSASYQRRFRHPLFFSSGWQL